MKMYLLSLVRWTCFSGVRLRWYNIHILVQLRPLLIIIIIIIIIIITILPLSRHYVFYFYQ